MPIKPFQTVKTPSLGSAGTPPPSFSFTLFPVPPAPPTGRVGGVGGSRKEGGGMESA
jgi:hypothetical protein